MNKLLAPGLVAIAAIAILATTLSVANAQSSGGISLVQRIAERFNLKQTDVQAVFDEVKTEKTAARQEKMNTRLDQFVTDGKITEAQKTLILAKQAEIKTKLDALKDLTPDQRKAKMDEIKTDLKAWSAANGITIPFGMGIMGPMGKGMMRGGMGHFRGDFPDAK